MIDSRQAGKLSEDGSRKKQNTIMRRAQQQAEEHSKELNDECRAFALRIRRNHEESILEACDEGKTEVVYHSITDWFGNNIHIISGNNMNKNIFKEFINNAETKSVTKLLEDAGFKVKIKRTSVGNPDMFNYKDSVYYIEFKISW